MNSGSQTTPNLPPNDPIQDFEFRYPSRTYAFYFLAIATIALVIFATCFWFLDEQDDVPGLVTVGIVTVVFFLFAYVNRSAYQEKLKMTADMVAGNYLVFWRYDEEVRAFFLGRQFLTVRQLYEKILKGATLCGLAAGLLGLIAALINRRPILESGGFFLAIVAMGLGIGLVIVNIFVFFSWPSWVGLWRSEGGVIFTDKYVYVGGQFERPTQGNSVVSIKSINEQPTIEFESTTYRRSKHGLTKVVTTFEYPIPKGKTDEAMKLVKIYQS